MERESNLQLGFLKGDELHEFMRLWDNCLRTMDRGMEYRMDHGRALQAMRAFLGQYKEKGEKGWAQVCEELEIEMDEARFRISLSATWDEIREAIEESGSSVQMPRKEAHLRALFPLDIWHRGRAWIQICEAAAETHTKITGPLIGIWVSNFKALPMAEVPTLDDDEIQGDDETEGVSGVGEKETDVPQGTPGPPSEEKTARDGSLKHPPEIIAIIKRIASVMGQSDLNKVAAWGAALSDPVKIKFEELISWDKHSDADVLRIGSLTTGDFGASLRAAMRVVDRVIDRKTRLEDLYNLCNADGGRWEHSDGTFRVIITRQK
jgi:hypothetical protein